MPYPEPLVAPMRAELTRIGVEELMTPDAVDTAFEKASSGTMVLVVNSVCGCAAANARPAVTLARQSPIQPDAFTTVFAGQDLEATARAREYMEGIPPSSPFIALFKHSEPVFILERRNIEGRSASAIAMDLVGAFKEHCAPDGGVGTSDEGNLSGAAADTSAGGLDGASDVPSTFRSIL